MLIIALLLRICFLLTTSTAQPGREIAIPDGSGCIAARALRHGILRDWRTLNYQRHLILLTSGQKPGIVMMCLNIKRRVQYQILGTSPLSEYRPCVQGVNALSNVLRSPNRLNPIRASTAVTALPPISASPFLNADGPVDPNNDVINQWNAHHFSRLL